MADLRRLVLLTALVVGAPAALACSCWHPSPQELVNAHGLIFAGTVIEANATTGKATFRVHKVYKGEVTGDLVTIGYNNGSGSMCGIAFVAGESHTVFADRWPGMKDELYYTHLCSMIPYLSSPMRFQPALDAYALEVAAARRRVAADPRSRGPRENLVALYEKTSDHVPALRELETLRGMVPGDAAIPARIGDIQLKLEQPAAALKAFEAALALDPGLETAKRGRDQALAKLGRGAEMDSARRSYAGMTLPKADFSGRDLNGADFSKAQLEAPRFERAQLRGANFSNAEIRHGSFAEASMIGARFDGVRTYEVSFAGCDLNGANFAGADLRMGRFTGADLRGASLAGAKAEQANFSGARMQGANFAKAYLIHADFSGVDLSGVDLRGLELQGVVLRGAKLVDADLGGAMLAGPLVGYRENKALLEPGRAPDLRGADLTGAKLAGTDFRYALFDCKTRWPAGFDPLALPLLPITSAECPGPPAKTTLFAKPGELREMPGRFPTRDGLKVRGPEVRGVNLAGADLSGAGLSGFQFWSVDLSGARLRGTDLRNADLQTSNLSDADLSGADLSGATLWGVKYNERTKWPAGTDPAAATAYPRR